MPKERRDRSLSHESSRASPYPSSSNRVGRSAPKVSQENVKEWEEARCPVCMEHPHNAVLLICSSHEKGCRPYMCNTSYRHSNCLDQFRKSFADTSSTIPQVESQISNTVQSRIAVPEDRSEGTVQSRIAVPEDRSGGIVQSIIDVTEDRSEGTVQSIIDVTEDRSEGTVQSIIDVTEERSEGLVTMQALSCENEAKSKLVCPLCRGQIKEWKVVEAARHFMNEKSRSCSCETCNFTGTYPDLRKHARLEHPLERPSTVDPERQRNWRRLERQRDLGDLLSTLQTSFGVDDPIDDGGLLAVFFLILQPASVSRGTTLQMRIRRPTSTLWGENYDGQSGSDDANESSDGGSDSRPRRVRRRLTPSP